MKRMKSCILVNQGLNNSGKNSLETLRRYAEAVGYELKTQLIPKLKGGIVNH